jgi:hypothetical protein
MWQHAPGMTQALATAGPRHGLVAYLRAERVPVRHQVGVLAVLLGVAISRSPYPLIHGRFFAEEGSIYYPHMRDQSIWFVAQSVGYIYGFLNGATWLAARVPIEHAPLVTAWLSLALVVVVAWAALALPSTLLPNAGGRLAAAILLVVGPVAVPVVWVNATNAQVYLGVLAVLFVFLDVPQLGRRQFGVVVALLALAGISGLYAAVLAPLFVALAYRERIARRIVLAGVTCACAIAQILVIAGTHASGDLAQGRGSFRGLGAITRDVAAWHVGSWLLGNSLANDLYRFADNIFGIAAIGLVAFLVGVVLACALAAAPRRRVVVLLVSVFVLEELLVLFGTRNGAGGRYAVVPVAILVLAAVHVMATATNHAAIGVAATLCAITFVAGMASFWTSQPSTLRCNDCPVWQEHVRAWKAGRTDFLRIWPYAGGVRWTVHLRHQRPPAGRAGTGLPAVRPRRVNSPRRGVGDPPLG